MSLKILKEIKLNEEPSSLKFYHGIKESVSTKIELLSLPRGIRPNGDFLVLGIIADNYPLVEHESTHTLYKVLMIKGVLNREENTKYRIVLFSDVAKEVESAKVNVGDFFAVLNPTIVKNSAYKKKNDNSLFHLSITYGRKVNTSLSCWICRKTVLELSSDEEVESNEEVSKERKITHSKTNGPKTLKKTLKRFSKESFIDCNDAPSTSKRICNKKVGKVPPNVHSPKITSSLVPEISQKKMIKACSVSLGPPMDESSLSFVTSTPKKTISVEAKQPSLEKKVNCDENFNSENTTEETSVKAAKDKALKNVKFIITGSSVSNTELNNIVQLTNNSYVYNKISEFQAGQKTNLYAVVLLILSAPKDLDKHKTLLRIAVTDESFYPKDFVVSLFYCPKAAPTVKKYDIVRFHRLSIESYQGKLDGRILNGWDLVTFDPNDVNETSNEIKGIYCGKTCTMTDEDALRIFELKKWMTSQFGNKFALSNNAISKPEYVDEEIMSLIEDPAHAVFSPTYFLNNNFVIVSKIRYESVFNLKCEVFNKYLLQDDTAILLIGDGRECILELPNFSPETLSTQKTLADCLKTSKPMKNVTLIFIVLKNVSSKPVFKSIQARNEIAIYNCKVCEEDVNGVTYDVLCCDLEEGDIKIINLKRGGSWKIPLTTSKKLRKQFLESVKEKTSCDEPSSSIEGTANAWAQELDKDSLKETHEKEKNCSPSSMSSSVHGSKTLSVSKGSKIFSSKEDISSKEKNDAASINDQEREDQNPKNSEVGSTSALVKLIQCDKVDKCVQLSKLPPITELTPKALSNTFAALTHKIKHKNPLPKEACDVPGLNQVLSPNSDHRSLPLLNDSYVCERANLNVSHRSDKNLNHSFTWLSPMKLDLSDSNNICGMLHKDVNSSKSCDSTSSDSNETEFSNSVEKMISPTKLKKSSSVIPGPGEKCDSTSSEESVAPQLVNSSKASNKANSSKEGAVLKKSIEGKQDAGPVKKSSSEVSNSIKVSMNFTHLNTKTPVLVDSEKGPVTKVNCDVSKSRGKKNSKNVNMTDESFYSTAGSNMNHLEGFSQPPVLFSQVEQIPSYLSAESTKNASESEKNLRNSLNDDTATVVIDEKVDVDDNPQTLVNNCEEQNDIISLVECWLNTYRPSPTNRTIRKANDPKLDASLEVKPRNRHKSKKIATINYLVLKIEPVNQDLEPAIVSGFCASRCQKYEFFSVLPMKTDDLFCKCCLQRGAQVPLSLIFLIRFHLIQLNSLRHVKALLASPIAETFLGCSVSDFITNETIRSKVLNNLKKLLLHNPSIKANGLQYSQKLCLILKPKIFNEKELLQIVEFEIPKVLSS